MEAPASSYRCRGQSQIKEQQQQVVPPPPGRLLLAPKKGREKGSEISEMEEKETNQRQKLTTEPVLFSFLDGYARADW